VTGELARIKTGALGVRLHHVGGDLVSDVNSNLDQRRL
jgi:hypothetical protein